MPFFNKKEDVIDIQLTSYGKRLLAQGSFKPVYYSFIDDGIIYDGLYAHVSESQNDINDRIKDLAYFKSNPVDGVETNINQSINMFQQNEKSFIKQDVKADYSLGTNKLGSTYAPAWNIQYLNGEITGSIAYVSSSIGIANIPQFTNHIVYQTFINENTDTVEEEVPKLSDVGLTRIFSDGTFIDINEDFILLKIEEKNVQFLNENFDIQMFKITENFDSKQNKTIVDYEPLKFLDKESKNQQFFVIDDNVDSTFVDYYFDVLVDNEIDESIFCSAERTNCVVGKENKPKDIYRTKLVDDDEECS